MNALADGIDKYTYPLKTTKEHKHSQGGLREVKNKEQTRERERKRETDRQTDRQTETGTERKTVRQREKDRNKERQRAIHTESVCVPSWS